MADDPEAANLAGPSQERRDAQVAAAATAREIPQGGGTAASLAGAAAGHSTGPESQALRIVANPSLPGPSPMFVKHEQVGAFQEMDLCSNIFHARSNHSMIHTEPCCWQFLPANVLRFEAGAFYPECCRLSPSCGPCLSSMSTLVPALPSLGEPLCLTPCSNF